MQENICFTPKNSYNEYSSIMTTFLAAPTVNIKSVHLAELTKLLQSNWEKL